MLRFIQLLVLLSAAACGAPHSATVVEGEAPQRIISLDFCADQYVLKFVERDHILALSPDARKPFSYMREAAKGIDTVRPFVENILILEPDLVVRSYGGGPDAARLIERAGVPVLNVGWAGDIEGIKRVTRGMATGLGVPEKGEALVAEIDARLATIEEHVASRAARGDAIPEALYVTPSGTTSGSGSFIHEMLTIAGLDNFQKQAGWRSIPLERLAYEEPDMVATAFFDTHMASNGVWSAMRHPIARKQIADHPTVHLKGDVMSCGAWFAMDGIEALAFAPQEVGGGL